MQTKWIERHFNFDFPVGMMPVIIERLRGTPSRIELYGRAVAGDFDCASIGEVVDSGACRALDRLWMNCMMGALMTFLPASWS